MRRFLCGLLDGFAGVYCHPFWFKFSNSYRRAWELGRRVGARPLP
jgi:hypothetical protein